MQLNLQQEIVGTLSEIRQKTNHIELIFMIQKTVEIPRGAISEAELEVVVGKRVGIFHSGTEGYRIRKVKG